MFGFIMVAYASAAVGFYREIYRRAPVIEEEPWECKIYELFPAEQEEEVRRAA